MADKRPPSQKAIDMAAQIWCDKRTAMKVLDPDVTEVVAEKLEELLTAFNLACEVIADVDNVIYQAKFRFRGPD